MSNSSKSVLVFGIYLIVLGLTAVVVPEIPLRIFELPQASPDLWFRFTGMFAFLVGIYTRRGQKPMF